MDRYQIEGLEIIFDSAGRDDWGKFSFPVWYGIPVKINWREYRYDFNLRGGLKKVSGTTRVWPDPREVLKRTDGNGLIYYGTHGYESSYDLLKSYYVPFNGLYDSDLFEERPLEGGPVRRALENFEKLTVETGRAAAATACGRPREFLMKVAARGRKRLAEEAGALHRIMGVDLPVLPPDTIDVDYEVIPLILSEGCTYNCRFCLFKSTGGFRVRSLQNIAAQVRSLKDFYGPDLINYNSLMLGQNNALAAGEALLLGAAEMAYEGLNLSASYHRGRPNLFLFGSVDSFLEMENSLLDRLEKLPYRTSINVGMESFDQETLDRLGKPLRAERVREAFRKMVAVNRSRSNIGVSCNLVLGGDLPSRHLDAIQSVLAAEATARDRGDVYLSPLIGQSKRRGILKAFREMKRASPLPVFIYLAQRL